MLTGKIQSWLASHGLSGLQTKLRIDNIDTCVEMARYGLGWCILPQICLKNFDGYTEKLILTTEHPL